MYIELGKLYILEGPDGVGKTTLAKEIIKRFEADQPFIYLAFPGRAPGTLGEHVYKFHHAPDSFGVKSVAPASLQIMHIAAHIDALEGLILPTLKSGKNIILDRFWWSTWVYGITSGLKRRFLRKLIRLEIECWDNILPSAVFLINRSDISIANNDVQKIQRLYRELAEDQLNKYPVNFINNDRTIEDALAQIIQVIQKTNSGQKPKPSAKQDSIATQLGLKLLDTLSQENNHLYTPTFFTRLNPAKPTIVYETYWKFAAERQEIFFRKLQRSHHPWTDDPILAKYKFTNAYRASDRVSQYLIRNVIYDGDQSPDELFFRIVLFKIFNRIETWKLLLEKQGQVTYLEYRFERYDEIFTEAMQQGHPIFSPAYIMPSGGHDYKYPKKHQNYLRVLEKMMADKLFCQIAEAHSMQDVYELLLSYPLFGSFLAYQFSIDINYSNLTNFSEMEFVIPGPGAKDGLRKCFETLGGLTEADMIRIMADRQTQEFERLGLNFKSLFGRPLQLIDCQNLFCEVDKYARVAHPDAKGSSGRVRIKQNYAPRKESIDFWYPPKWGLNPQISLIKYGESKDDNSL